MRGGRREQTDRADRRPPDGNDAGMVRRGDGYDEGRRRWLRDVLEPGRLYTFRFMADDRQTEFVCASFADRALAREISDSMTMVILDPTGSPDAALNDLRTRWPVHIAGQPVHDMFDESYARSALGVHPAPRCGGVRYVLAGLAHVDIPRAARGSPAIVGVVHAWGVDLEARGTEDWRRHMRGDRLDVARYRDTVSRTLAGCIAAARSLIGTEAGRHRWSRGAELRLPLLGLGAFLNGVPHERDRRAAVACFLEAVAAAVRGCARFGVSTKLCLTFDPLSHDDLGPWMRSTETRHLLASGELAVARESLFDARDRPAVLSVLVNCWDPRSFVGNAGSRDPTLDGFVTSAAGPGAALPNDCYLHNAFLLGGHPAVHILS